MLRSLQLIPTILVLLVATFFAADGFAEDWEQEELDALSLEDLLSIDIASATFHEQQLKTAPSIVAVLSREQMLRFGLRNLGQALQMMAGVTVLDTQMGQPEISIRGIKNPANILVMLDGIPLNDFYDGRFPADFPLEGIDRIELIRGPGSAMYGTNAFAGIISLYSLRGGETLDVETSQVVLPEDELTFGGGVLGRFVHSPRVGKYQIRSMLLSKFSQGPRFKVTDDSLIKQSYSQAPGFTNAYRYTHLGQVGATAWGVLAEADEIDMGLIGLHQERGPFYGLRNSFTPDGKVSEQLVNAYLQYSVFLSSKLVLKTRTFVSQHETDEKQIIMPAGYSYDHNGNGEIDGEEYYAEGKVHLRKYRTTHFGEKAYLQHSYMSANNFWQNHFAAGLAFDLSLMPVFEFTQNYDDDKPRQEFDEYMDVRTVQTQRTRFVSAAFVQNQMAIGDLWFTSGLRFDNYSDFGFAASPSLAFVWQVLPVLSLKAVYGRAFRAPTFKELYDQTSTSSTLKRIAGNEDLPAETTNTFELAADLDVGKVASYRLSLFVNRTDNSIEINGAWDNKGSAYLSYPGRRIVGAEVEWLVYLDGRNYLLANLSTFDAIQLGEGLEGWQQNSDLRFNNVDLKDLPRIRGNVGLTSQPLDDLKLSAAYSYTDASSSNSRFTNEAIFLTTDRQSFHQLSGNAIYTLADGHFDLSAYVARSIGKVVPIALMYREYDLAVDEWIVMSTVTFHVEKRRHR